METRLRNYQRKEGIDPEVRMLLEYLDSKTVTNELTKELDQAVEEARLNEKWSFLYNSSIGNFKKEG